jgi:phage anti-repressor protein
MVVKLDNEIIGEVDVTSEQLQDYEFKKTVKPGRYDLSISFTNDLCVVDKNGKMIEDRNLFVRRCRIVYEQ